MSGIFGIFHTDSKPVGPETLIAMDAAMAYWGGDGGGLLANNNIGMGSRLFRVTPEDELEQQPLKFQHLTLVAHARVDNREELLTKLGRKNTICPDSLVILHMYLKYGEDCFDLIIGEWSIALWDEKKKKLTLALSATGNVSMCWAKVNSTFIFSNGLQGILAYPSLTIRPNPYYLAGLLSMFYDPNHANETAYENIFRLAPGHKLTIDAHNFSIKQWWEPQHLKQLIYNHDQDYYEAFLEIYSDAVAKRIRTSRGAVATTLSSGFDSSSVAAIAAPILATKGERLMAYVHTPLFEPTCLPQGRIANEFPLASSTASFVGNIDPIACNSAGWSIIENIKLGLDIHAQPNGTASNNYWMHNIFQIARNSNTRILLNGQGGNATVSYKGKGNLIPELKKGELRIIQQELLNEVNGIYSAVKRRVIGPLISPSVQYLKQKWNPIDKYHWKEFSHINQSWAKEILLSERMLACGHSGSILGTKPSAERVNLWRLSIPKAPESVGSRWMQWGAYYGLAMNDPTVDKRVVEFCWRIPDRVFWAHGTQRALIRQGMKNKLPPEILQNSARGLQSADLAMRIRTELEELNDCIQQLENNQLIKNWLAFDRMRITLQSLQNQSNEKIDHASLSALLKSVSVGLFLQKF
jgi:asparagine synthase (glutamine-hydrolysing)